MERQCRQQKITGLHDDTAEGTDGNDDPSRSTGVPNDSDRDKPYKAGNIINILADAATNLDTALDITGVKSESVNDNVSGLLLPPSRNDELGPDYSDDDNGKEAPSLISNTDGSDRK